MTFLLILLLFASILVTTKIHLRFKTVKADSEKLVAKLKVAEELRDKYETLAKRNNKEAQKYHDMLIEHEENIKA